MDDKKLLTEQCEGMHRAQRLAEKKHSDKVRQTSFCGYVWSVSFVQWFSLKWLKVVEWCVIHPRLVMKDEGEHIQK